MMWEGKTTEELERLIDQYAKAHYGVEPDGYDELNYDAMTCEEFAGFIKAALEQGVELPEVVP